MEKQSWGTRALWLSIIVLLGVGGWLWWDRGTTELQVTGRATLKAMPDEYTFTPRYEERGTDQAVLRSAVTDIGNGVIVKLREAGVADAAMKADVDVSQDYRPLDTAAPVRFVATYALTIQLTDRALATRVLEVLTATPVVGGVTPQMTFSAARQRELELEARKQALEDAQTQAEDTSESLGLHVRGVKAISDPTWSGWPYATTSGEVRAIAPSADNRREIPELLEGEQEVSYQIEVTYRMR